jgi:hypothetical protein
MNMRAAFLSMLACGLLWSDEGMWTFDNVPAARIRARYGFTPDAPWLRKLQLATLRFPGGTGAFVGAEGLVLTNHHVARGYIQKLSTAGRDLVKEGFAAADRSQEQPLPGLELLMLVEAENVTALVDQAVPPGTPDAAALMARKAALSRIQKAREDATGLTCEAVTLYHGGEYWMYRYRKFTDVRLVACPEEQLAAFGHDPDNFAYPRHDLDFTLLRVYEKGQPYHPEAWLPPATAPLRLGDPVFITGHPGTTYRQDTQAQMLYQRDTAIPYAIRAAEARLKALEAYGATSAEARRLTRAAVYGQQNGIKRLQGQLLGLQKPRNLEKVQAAEHELKMRVGQDPDLLTLAGPSWDLVSRAVEAQKALLPESPLDGRHSVFQCDLLTQALMLLRLGTETARPEDLRLPEFREGALKLVRSRILNAARTDPGVDAVLLAAGLQGLLDNLGPDHPAVKALLGDRTPGEAAKAAMAGTRFQDLAFRKALLEGGATALDACPDPLLAFARVLDPFSRAFQKRQEDLVQGILTEQGGRIAQARFKIYGKAAYPDATFTLRLAYGSVATYPAGGTLVQPCTTFHGLYDRALAWGPEAEGGAWALPARWMERMGRLDLSTPLDFINSCDTAGGNSGSPAVNTRGEILGLNFDSNFEGQAGYFVYDGATKRSIVVDIRAILAALSRVMDAQWVVDELQRK